MSNKQSFNKENSLIEIPEEINKSSSKEKYAYIFKILKQAKVFKKYTCVNAIVTKVEDDRIHLIIKSSDYNEKKAICLKENYGEMSKKDVDYIFRLGSKHKFIITLGTEKNDVVELNYKVIHPEVNSSLMKISPTFSHFWNMKLKLNKYLERKKENKYEKNSNNSRE